MEGLINFDLVLDHESAIVVPVEKVERDNGGGGGVLFKSGACEPQSELGGVTPEMVFSGEIRFPVKNADRKSIDPSIFVSSSRSANEQVKCKKKWCFQFH